MRAAIPIDRGSPAAPTNGAHRGCEGKASGGPAHPAGRVGAVGGHAGAKNACHIEESVAFLLDNIDDDATTATIDTMRCGARRTRR